MAQASYVGRVTLYLFEPTTSQYTDYGSQGLAIMGSPEGIYKLGCYNDKGEYVATAPITANNEASARLALQGQGYVNFKDETNRHWSMLFASEDDAIEFGAHFAVAMYGAAFQPESNVMVCDVAQGKKERLLFVNDKVKVRYTSWVVTRGAAGKEICKLGSKLETNENDERPYAFTVPANHVSVTNDMKGFEGMVVGVGEEGRRFVVIPQAAKRGAGPNAHMCFYVNILRKRDEDVKPNQQQGGNGMMGMNQQQGMHGGNYGMQQQQNQWGQQQPLALGAGPSMGGPMNNYNGALALVDDPRHHQQHQVAAAAAPVVTPPVVVEAPPPPPPGFNAEQLQIVDRMRDQIQALTLQLREATQKLDMFRNDFNQNDAKTKPQSLSAAQLEHSISKMLQDTDAMKDELSQRDTMLRQVEDRNKELQKKVDRFSATANQLADEKKSAINSGSEEKLDLDRRIAQLQTSVTRINGERDDVIRHMSTVKRLLEVSDQDMKTEKNKLQLAIVQFQTNETKLVTIEENLAEERARKKVLESKVISLGEEMRSVAEELRIKEGQIEERKRKIEADKLHYTQVMEEERSQSAQELRDLRQELIEEIAIRDRRYGEEKLRVAQESTERGRVQGVDDGTNDALLEADAKIQEYVLQVQRCKSEVEGMKIRLRQIKEQAEADHRRINSQSSTLSHTLDELVAQNSASEIEIESLKATKVTVEEQTYDLLCQTLRSLTRDVSKRDLLTIIHELRIKKPVDFTFEVAREDEEHRRLDDEREDMRRWARACVASFPTPAIPHIRTKAPDERLVLSSNSSPLAPSPIAPSPVVDTVVPVVEAQSTYQDPVVEVHGAADISDDEGQHEEDLQTAHAPPPLPQEDDEEEAPADEAVDPFAAAAEEASFNPQAPSATDVALDDDGSEYSEEEEAGSPQFASGDFGSPVAEAAVPTPAPPMPAPAMNDRIVIANRLPTIEDSEEEDEVRERAPLIRHAAPSSAAAPPQPKRSALPTFTDDDEDDIVPPPKPPVASAPTKVAPRAAALFGDSDSDDDIPAPAPRKAPAAVPKKAAPKRSALFDDSD